MQMFKKYVRGGSSRFLNISSRSRVLCPLVVQSPDLVKVGRVRKYWGAESGVSL